MKQWLILRQTPLPEQDFWSLVFTGAKWAWWAWALSQGNIWLILFGLFIFNGSRQTTILTPKWVLLWGIRHGIYSLRGLSEYRVSRNGLNATFELMWNKDEPRKRRKLLFIVPDSPEILSLVWERLDATGAVDADLELIRILKQLGPGMGAVRYQRTRGCTFEEALRAVETL
ncbi:MAG: hypothetical protein KY445_02325 [Armatimonadetes bacterium]|nr:hypothetical protein [Armatimonadota bacterium]